jgi:transposase-like protein
VPATTSAKLWARAGGQQGFETAIIERCGRRESPVEEALIKMRLEGASVLRAKDITEALFPTHASRKGQTCRPASTLGQRTWQTR